MGLRMESCRPWWCCSGSAPPPPGTGTGTALGPGGWPRLCSDGSPGGGGGGLSSSAGLEDEWSGVPDGVFSSSELPSTDLPLPFSDAASGLLELEFSLFSLQVQEQSSQVSGETGLPGAATPGARACCPPRSPSRRGLPAGVRFLPCSFGLVWGSHSFCQFSISQHRFLSYPSPGIISSHFSHSQSHENLSCFL